MGKTNFYKHELFCCKKYNIPSRILERDLVKSCKMMT